MKGIVKGFVNVVLEHEDGRMGERPTVAMLYIII